MAVPAAPGGYLSAAFCPGEHPVPSAAPGGGGALRRRLLPGPGGSLDALELCPCARNRTDPTKGLEGRRSSRTNGDGWGGGGGAAGGAAGPGRGGAGSAAPPPPAAAAAGPVRGRGERAEGDPPTPHPPPKRAGGRAMSSAAIKRGSPPRSWLNLRRATCE